MLSITSFSCGKPSPRTSGRTIIWLVTFPDGDRQNRTGRVRAPLSPLERGRPPPPTTRLANKFSHFIFCYRIIKTPITLIRIKSSTYVLFSVSYANSLGLRRPFSTTSFPAVRPFKILAIKLESFQNLITKIN